METITDRETFKASFRKLAKEDPAFIQSIIIELNEESKNAKFEKLKQIVTEDFIRYEDVFKALA